MAVEDLHNYLVQYFTAFFEDFNYVKTKDEQAIYRQDSGRCHKLIFLNISDYKDGLMIEFKLGISQLSIEYQLSELLGKSTQSLHQLTYHIYPEGIDISFPKRSFLNPAEPTDHYCKQMEDFFVNAGFYWLDEYGHSKKLSDMIALTLIKEGIAPVNIHLSALRSLLLKQQLGETITEDLFFTYLEIMQEKGIPDQEIGLYAQFRKFFIPR